MYRRKYYTINNTIDATQQLLARYRLDSFSISIDTNIILCHNNNNCHCDNPNNSMDIINRIEDMVPIYTDNLLNIQYIHNPSESYIDLYNVMT